MIKALKQKTSGACDVITYHVVLGQNKSPLSIIWKEAMVYLGKLYAPLPELRYTLQHMPA
ncbi:hypothetical protein [Aneurinibacillus tyrosinisolvens]|uniref:hypothetical protein n=1 Tax=Aneurinibacillus tyrosinisolvens TaxID=1443435 RepID=UPI00063FAE9B|nr:hypothetical protein [Aneurinibacillus tyrosinisolvens]